MSRNHVAQVAMSIDGRLMLGSHGGKGDCRLPCGTSSCAKCRASPRRHSYGARQHPYVSRATYAFSRPLTALQSVRTKTVPSRVNAPRCPSPIPPRSTARSARSFKFTQDRPAANRTPALSARRAPTPEPCSRRAERISLRFPQPPEARTHLFALRRASLFENASRCVSAASPGDKGHLFALPRLTEAPEAHLFAFLKKPLGRSRISTRFRAARSTKFASRCVFVRGRRRNLRLDALWT